MMVPGSNLLNIALSVIQPTSGVFVKKFQGDGENSFGGTVKTYTDPLPLNGVSVQPVTKEQIQQTGLALNKEYIYIWTRSDVESAYRGRQCDLINWNGEDYEVAPESDWIKQDGWKQVTAVKL